MSRSANEQDKPKVILAITWGHKHGLTLNGLYYDEELAGHDGATHWIFATEKTPNEQVEGAIRELDSNHDSVGFTVIRIPQAWIDEVLTAQVFDGDIMDKVRAIVEGRSPDNTLTWPNKQCLHIDPTTANLLVKVFDAADQKTQVNICKAANVSPAKFMRVVDIAWKCVA